MIIFVHLTYKRGYNYNMHEADAGLRKKILLLLNNIIITKTETRKKKAIYIYQNSSSAFTHKNDKTIKRKLHYKWYSKDILSYLK